MLDTTAPLSPGRSPEVIHGELVKSRQEGSAYVTLDQFPAPDFSSFVQKVRPIILIRHK